MLIPFFYWDRAGYGLATNLVTPLGGYSRDDHDGTQDLGDRSPFSPSATATPRASGGW